MSTCRSANRLSLSTPEGQKYILYFRDISPWLLLNALYTGLSQQIYVMSQLTWYKLKPNLYEPYVLRVRVSLYDGFETTRKPHSFKMSGKKKAGKTNDQNRSKQILMCVILELGLNSLKEHSYSNISNRAAKVS